MSLINQVLQNLDARDATPPGLHKVARGVKPATPHVRRSRPLVVYAVLAFALIVAAALYLAPHAWLQSFVSPFRSPRPVHIEKAGLSLQNLGGAPHAEGARVMSPVPPGRLAATSEKLQLDPQLASLSLLGHRAPPVPLTSSAPSPGQAAQRSPTPSAPTPQPELQLPVKPAPSGTPVADRPIVLEVSPQSPRERQLAEIRAAEALAGRGMVAEAEVKLLGLLSTDPRNMAARQVLTALYVRFQREEDLRRVLREGLDLMPAEPSFLLPYARLLGTRGDWQGALAVMAPAADALAADAEYRALTAAILQRLARYADSAGEYRAALRLAPRIGAWWVGLGVSLEAEGRLQDARAAYVQAQGLALTPELARFVDSKLARLP